MLKWLLFPITGPVLGTKWVAGQVLDEAERQYYDEAVIRQEMLALERMAERGDVDEETFEACSEQLLERLLESRTRRKEQESG